jgi:hypothetical protein
MLDMQVLSFAPTTEKNLLRQIDHSVSRALVDGVFAQTLLADPTVAVEQAGCTPQAYRKLRQIHASDLEDFARQALALFWPMEPTRSRVEDARRQRRVS